MTIQEASKYCREQLMAIYDENESAAITDWLIEHLTGLKRAGRDIRPGKLLESSQESALREYVARLLTHEPLQYVLNEAWFCGLRFYVDQHVLIPRPETEELVEWIISQCKFPLTALKVIDIGTGSGCIAISLKRRLGKVDLWACDISTGAIEVAKKNAKDIGVEVTFVEMDFLDEKAREKLPAYDIIVSNPPYIPEKDKATMNENVVKYEPSSALFVPNGDPLLFYRALAVAGKEHLTQHGSIYAEIHESLGAGLIKLFESEGYSIEIKKDMQGKDRMIRACLIPISQLAN